MARVGFRTESTVASYYLIHLEEEAILYVRCIRTSTRASDASIKKNAKSKGQIPDNASTAISVSSPVMYQHHLKPPMYSILQNKLK